MMAAPSRNGGWEGYSSSSSQGSFQRPSALPHVGSFNRLPCVPNDEGLDNKSEQQSLFAAANSFVSAVTAMDKHVMIPNRLRDHRLPGSSATLPATGPAASGERSRHNSGQSMGAGSLGGCVSLSSDCSDPVGSAENGSELADTDMYSCYRLLNTLKSELLSRTITNNDVTDEHSGTESDSDSELANRSATPKEECVMFTAGSSSNAVTEDTVVSSLSALSVDPPGSTNTTTESNQPASSERRSPRRITSASTSVAVTSTEAVKQRFRMHLRGLMSIMSQLTETANLMTNYYDKCLIPGANATTTLPTGGLNLAGSSSSQAPPTAFNMNPLNPINGQLHSNGNGETASHLYSVVEKGLFQPTRLF